MSIFHLSAQIIGRSNGRSSTAAAAYRAGCRIADARTGEVHNFTRKRGVRETFILAPSHAPEWMRDRSSLWNGVEQIEKRKDAQLAREIEVALPHELPHDLRRALLVEFVDEEFISRGMVADVALHAPGREGDRRNEHAHIMLTLRNIEGEGFGGKAREWNDVGLVEKWRASWAQRINTALKAAAHLARVDHRSYAQQALADGHDMAQANLGTVHLGAQASAAERRGIRTVPGDLNREVRAINLELERIRLATLAEDENTRQASVNFRAELREAVHIAHLRSEQARMKLARLSAQNHEMGKRGSQLQALARAHSAAIGWRKEHPFLTLLHALKIRPVDLAELHPDPEGLQRRWMEMRAASQLLQHELQLARADVNATQEEHATLRRRLDEAATHEAQQLDHAETKAFVPEMEDAKRVDIEEISADVTRPIPRLKTRGFAPYLG